jgi:hypothetical protein
MERNSEDEVVAWPSFCISLSGENEENREILSQDSQGPGQDWNSSNINLERYRYTN